MHKEENSENEKITEFGTWAMKANIDIELGYYFDIFIKEYPDDIMKEPVFQLLNIISASDNYNCELFYKDIDPEQFKFNLIDQDKNSKNLKTLIDFSKITSENIINNALIKYNQEESPNNNKINYDKENNSFRNLEYIEYISPYYSLFSKLDEIYSPKNIFRKNKIFTLGDWLISLYFINQYKLIKCLRHNYYSEESIELCQKCKISKYYYCQVYSLNEKFFTKQKSKISHIKSVCKLEYLDDKNFTIPECENEEKTIAKWNIIYMNLISNKSTEYISINQIKKYNSELSRTNFKEILENLYQGYKKLYIDIVSKYLEITKNEDEMIIQKKIFENKEGEVYKFEIFFNKIDKVNLMKSYFFEFIPKDIDKFFCLTKFRKILSNKKSCNKISILSISPDIIGIYFLAHSLSL